MNLLMLILIALGIIVAVSIFRFAWKLTTSAEQDKPSRPTDGRAESRDSAEPPD